MKNASVATNTYQELPNNGMVLQVPGLAELLQEVSDLKAEIQVMRSCLPVKRTVSVSDIARMEGVSRSSLYGVNSYLLPRCGKSAYPDGTTRWDMEEYLEWRRIPPSERKRMLAETLRQELKMKRKNR